MPDSSRATSSNGWWRNTHTKGEPRTCFARRFGYLRTVEEYRRTIFFPTPLRRVIVESRAFESSNLILSYTFNMFVIIRHICVTQWFVSLARRHNVWHCWLIYVYPYTCTSWSSITYLSIVNYPYYQLLCWYLYMYFICVQVNMCDILY